MVTQQEMVTQQNSSNILFLFSGAIVHLQDIQHIHLKWHRAITDKPKFKAGVFSEICTYSVPHVG